MSFCHKLKFSYSISLQPYGVHLWYFKLRLFGLTEFIVWNVKGPRHWVARILGLENQSLWQRLNSFKHVLNTYGLYIIRIPGSQFLKQSLLIPSVGYNWRVLTTNLILVRISYLIFLSWELETNILIWNQDKETFINLEYIYFSFIRLTCFYGINYQKSVGFLD